MTPRAGGVALASAVLLTIAAAVLGGGSLDTPLRCAAVELCALPALFLGLGGVSRGGWRRSPAALVILAAVIAIPVLQLVPLPQQLWERLPGRSLARQALSLAGLPTPWLPLTIARAETVRCLLALTAPVAMFLIALRLEAAALPKLIGIWIGLAVAGLFLGAMQIASHRPDALAFYREAVPGAFVGFFANRNHFATFLLALIPLAALLFDVRERGALGWLGALFLPSAVIGLAAIQSRAGVVLAIPALAGAVAVWLVGREPRRDDSAGPNSRMQMIAAGSVVVALIGIASFRLSPLVQRFRLRGVAEGRFDAWPHVIRAAESYLPFGAGVGAFSRAFQLVEPLSFAGGDPFPHAHNEFLEVWLETGWFGPAVLAAFLGWAALTVRRAASGPERTARAAAIAAATSVGVILAHATVDYAMRTLAVATLFAFSCGILARTARSPATNRNSGVMTNVS
ncbi:MAG: O-antigen ligase family protein [Caulobacterales bacterium]